LLDEIMVWACAVQTKRFAFCAELNVRFLSRIGREKGIACWPPTFPGWDDRPRAGAEKAFVTEGNTPERFGQMFRGALKFAGPATAIVMVEAWNEWGEGASIEPDKQYGFGYTQRWFAGHGFPGAVFPHSFVPARLGLLFRSALSAAIQPGIGYYRGYNGLGQVRHTSHRHPHCPGTTAGGAGAAQKDPDRVGRTCPPDPEGQGCLSR
jgi:hypothetical protein